MRRRWLAVVAVAAALPAGGATRGWVVDTARELLDGRGQGVAVTAAGQLRRAPGWREAARFEEAAVTAADVAPDGTVYAVTAFPARLYRVTEAGAERLADVGAEQATAVLALPDGAVAVATVAPGGVAIWRDGRMAPPMEAGVDGVWDLAWFAGGLVAAGGRPATLFRVRPQGLERWLELPDAHARSLAASGGRLVVGTSGRGLVLAVDGAGRWSLLADSPFTEIADVLVDPAGRVWAAAMVGAPEKEKAKRGAGGGRAQVTVTAASGKLKLPKVGGRTATSELLRLSPEGATLSVHRFTEQVAGALAWDGQGVLVGTGYAGEVWRFLAAGGARLAALDAAQVTAFAAGGRVACTQGPAAVLLRTGDGAGRYRIEPLALERPARWGRFRLLAGGPVRIRFRSGATRRPDATWSPWSGWEEATDGTVPAPPGRFLQWEVELEGDAWVDRVEVAYREVNLPPVIERLEVLAPGEVYLAAPPPTGQYVDVSHPDVNGIFTVIGEGRDGRAAASGQGKRYWRVGYRSVRWKARDPNGDPLRFDLALETEDGLVLPVRRRIEGTRLAVDTTALPEGRYRFRLTASDRPANPDAPLEVTETSAWFVVDNSPPVVRLERRGDRWLVVARDRWSPIARAEWSRDGKGWHPLAPEDGLLDGLEERFEIPAEPGRHLLVVRVVDTHHNRATAGGEEEP